MEAQGLGLSIVKKLVEGQEGSVSVKKLGEKVLHLALYCLLVKQI
jgi:signal transduction histidine kinase